MVTWPVLNLICGRMNDSRYGLDEPASPWVKSNCITVLVFAANSAYTSAWLLNSMSSLPVTMGMPFSNCSDFVPAFPSPYPSSRIGVDPVMVMPFTIDVTATPDATDVTFAVVVAVPPRVNTDASANVNGADWYAAAA